MCRCFAHGLNLLMKDFCKFAPASGPVSWERTYGLEWEEDLVADADSAANFFQGSGMARTMVCLTQTFIACGTLALVH
jgi:hypothetical protein